MEVVSGLLLLIDRAISLIKQREARHQALVKEIIEPMFADLESVHKDYNVMLQKLGDAIAHETSEEKIRAAARTFSQDRIQYLALRQKLRVLARVYRTRFPNDNLVGDFFKAVSYVVGEPGATSLPLTVEGFLHSLLAEGEFVTDVGDALHLSRISQVPSTLFLAPEMLRKLNITIDTMRHRTENDWAQACEHYAAIKASYSVPR